MRDVESFIRNQVRRILREDAPAAPTAPAASPTPTPSGGQPAGSGGGQAPDKNKESNQGPRVVRGRVGGGNFSAAVRAANSLADKNPAELVKKLGLKGATGSSNIERVESIVRQAVSGASVMQAAYSKPEIMQDESGNQFIRIPHNTEIKAREAAQYMFLVFQAAQKEGLLGGIKGKIRPGLVKADGKEIVAVLLQ